MPRTRTRSCSRPVPLARRRTGGRRWVSSSPRRRAARAVVAVLAVVAAATAGVVAAPQLEAPRSAHASPAGAAVALAPPSSPAPSTPLPEPVVDGTALVGDVTAAADAAGGSLTVVVDLPGGTRVAASPDADEPHYTASLVKLMVVQQLLAQASDGRAQLSTASRADAQRAISLSDDTAMNRLWTAFDGPTLVRSAAAEFGLSATAPPGVPGQWGQATTSAADLATFLTQLPGHLSDADVATLTGWMRDAAATGADGFDQAFGLRDPGVDSAGDVAVKQGWMCCVSGTRQLHSAGVLADGTVVVLLGEFPARVSWGAAAAALDDAARDVVAALAPR
jgi:hypothetical protein